MIKLTQKGKAEVVLTMVSITYRQCLWVPSVQSLDFDVDRQEICTEVSSDLLTDGTRECANGSTPPLRSVEPTLTAREYKDFWGNDYSETFNFGIWIGLEFYPDDTPKCLWMGQEEAGVCVSTCNLDADGNPALDDVESMARVLLDELDEFYDESGSDIIFTAGVAVVVAGIVAVGLYLSPTITAAVAAA